jgi:hypothetical protein
MKRFLKFYFLTAQLASLALLGVEAQAATPAFRLGPIAGLSVANQSINSSNVSVSFNSLTGFAGGLSAEFQLQGLPDWLYFQPELIYIQKGATIPASQNTAGTGQISVADNYLDIPLLLKAKYLTPVVSPYFLFGLDPAILMSSTPIAVGSTQVSKVNSIDLGLHFGVGAEYDLLPGTIVFFDIRYILGLTNIASGAVNQSVTNSDWLFLVGGRFDLF